MALTPWTQSAAVVCEVFAADVFLSIRTWWHEAKLWTLMYRGGLLAGVCGLVALVVWRVAAARYERTRLEALVASRTRQLRQSEELFRSIFEHATEGIFQSSLDGHNLRANPAMARLCGYESPAQMQRELNDVATQFYARPGRREEINTLVARSQSVMNVESEIRRRDGALLWISENVHTVVDPSNGQTVYQGSIVDVTARREMQAAHEQARLAAEAANAAKSAFLTHVTHELRTPLTGILSNARVALRDAGLDEANRSRYALIVRSGEHLLALIDEVLDLSRIEAGRMDLRSGPFSLEELLRTVGDGFRPRAAEKGLDFRWTLDPLLPGVVRADPQRLRQVLDNLLGNAFKFTAGGSVALDARGVAPGTIRFEVTDTGVGIPSDQLKAIFEPFRQVASFRPPDQAGAGLGLHISARLIRLMGGELRVESVPDRGSRFFFELPMPAGDAGADSRPPGRSGEGMPAGALISAVPAAAAIEELLTLSLEGDIVGLRARLKELAGADAALTEFTRTLEKLAAAFQMDAISELLVRMGQRQVAGPEASSQSGGQTDGETLPEAGA